MSVLADRHFDRLETIADRRKVSKNDAAFVRFLAEEYLASESNFDHSSLWQILTSAHHTGIFHNRWFITISVRCFERILEHDPRDTDALCELASCLTNYPNIRDLDRAEALIQRLEALDPSYRDIPEIRQNLQEAREDLKPDDDDDLDFDD